MPHASGTRLDSVTACAMSVSVDVSPCPQGRRPARCCCPLALFLLLPSPSLPATTAGQQHSVYSSACARARSRGLPPARCPPLGEGVSSSACRFLLVYPVVDVVVVEVVVLFVVVAVAVA
eukprot:gene10358-biopygen7757